MAINKRKTNNCKHYTAMRILSVYLDRNNKSRGMVSFIDHVGVEVHLRVTKEEYLHVLNGAGCDAEAFESGLTRTHRYRFAICTEQINHGDVTEETVTAIHAVPNDDYMDCDWTAELQELIPDGGVKITVRSNGGIDLISYPYQFRGREAEVLSKLEALDKINTATQFKIAGNATVRCKRTMDDNTAMLIIKADK
jgi:hypothetical protein